MSGAVQMKGPPVAVVDDDLTATTAIEKLWKRLYQLLRDWALFFAARWVGLEAAADIFQDVMFGYWKRRNKLTPDEFNEARVRAAVRKRVATQIARDRRFISLTPQLDEAGVVPEIAARAHDRNVELVDAVVEAAQKLALRRRTAWVLNKVEGFSREEGAEIMGIGVGTFSVHLYEAGVLITKSLLAAGFELELIERGMKTRALPAKTKGETSHV
jgi:RNA polymerase sigma factor (sigma-70 family)